MTRPNKIMVLAGGPDQADLIDLLKEMFPESEVILIDMAYPVMATSHADRHIQISTMDFDAVKECAVKEKVDCIITACGDQPLITMSQISEELGLPCYLTKAQALSMTNKLHMKKIMVENGIPTAKFRTITDENEDISDLGFPIMIKPADCNGSLGVRKANNIEEFRKYFQEAKNYSISNSAIVETFTSGTEVNVDCYAIDGHAKLLMYGNVRKKKIDQNITLIYQTYIPANISATALENIQKIADDITRVFKLNNTPILIQTIVNGDDVSVIEFAPRIGGGAKHRTITYKTGFDILKANITSMLGGVPDVKLNYDPYFYSRNHVYAYPGIYSHVENVDELIKEGIIVEYVPIRMKGGKIGEFYASRDRVGSFLVKAPTIEELEEKIQIAAQTLRIIDVNGKDIMKHQMFDIDDNIV